MKLITVEELVASIVDAWQSQYKSRIADDPNDAKTLIYWRLKQMQADGSASPAKIKEIIGNGSWTNLTCNECGKSGHPCVIEVGETPDYESSTAHLCCDCIRKAYEMTFK